MEEKIVYSMEIADRIRKSFETLQYPYEFDEKTGVFSTEVDLQGSLIKVHVLIHVLEKAFVSHGLVAVHPDPEDPEQMARMAEFLHRVNHELERGHFEMDYESGIIGYRNYVDCYGQLPGMAVIIRSFSICSSMFELYGTGIAGIVFSDASPVELKTMCESEGGPVSQLCEGMEGHVDELEKGMDRLRKIMRFDGHFSSGKGGINDFQIL